nr:PAS domain-containing sensor histidine kinase [Pseudomonas sp.]
AEPVAVAALLQTIANDARALSADQHHRISVEADSALMLRGCESELRSAFSNLVFNAVKYTPANGEIQLRWWQDGFGAHLAVQDSGIGIEARHLPRLTERFYRVDSSRASSTGGTGLGLAIVKHVLLRHQGRLDIDSSLGNGSTFICSFPLSQTAKR